MPLLIQLIDIYSLIVLVAVVTSWMQLPPSNPVANFTNTQPEVQLSEVIARPGAKADAPS